MSTLATNAITDASGGNTATINSYTPTESNMAGRNRLINSDMRIDQRNAGASVSNTSNLTYVVDRWAIYGDQNSKFTAQRSTVAPTGFINSLLMTSSSAYSVPSGEGYSVQQRIEGFNVSDLGWGTANAQTVTLSFWVRSSLTGTFGGSITNSAFNRSYPFSYTVSSANTYEYKTVTIAGDTAGTWLTDNGIGLRLYFGLGVGSTLSGTAGSWAGSGLLSATGATSVVGTSGATFYITGVQLEAGSVATPFEHRQYGQELALCQRYFWKIGGTALYEQIAIGLVDATTQVNCITLMPVAMRAAPSLGYSSASAFNVNDAAGQPSTTAVAINQAGLQTTGITVTASGLNVGRAARFFIGNSTSAYINFSSEL
jgi:hypothetical protein